MLSEIERFLTSLLFGSHCYVLVSLKETLRRRLGDVGGDDHDAGCS